MKSLREINDHWSVMVIGSIPFYESTELGVYYQDFRSVLKLLSENKYLRIFSFINSVDKEIWPP